MIPRRLAVLALAALLLGVAGVAAAVNRASDDDAPSVADETAAPASTTTSSFIEQPTTTTAPPAVATTTAAPPRPATTSTTRRQATATTRRMGAPTTTGTPPAPPPSGTASPRCTPDHLVATIATDRHSYTPSQVVQVTSALRNRSSTTCFYNGWSAGISFKNDAGTSYGGVQVVADSFADVPLRPGETLNHSGSWEHRACPQPGCDPLPPGPYYATVTWNIAGHAYQVLTSLILS